MYNLKFIEIFVPVPNHVSYDEVNEFYVHVLDFSYDADDGCLRHEKLPLNIGLHLIYDRDSNNLKRRSPIPIFSIGLEDNFLSYCDDVHKKDCRFYRFIPHSGGYYADLADPAGNAIGISCDSWEDIRGDVDPGLWNYI